MNITVSIVEDDAPTRGILAEWVCGADGYNCVGVHENAEIALAALPQENPSVVLMDINMSGMNGIECVRTLKPQMMGTQFIMLTVYEDPDHIFKAISYGASGYLLKRTPRSELFAAIKEAHVGGSPISSNIARKIIQSFQQFNNASPDEPNNLSSREREVLDLRARGYLYKEIADSLHINLPAVNLHSPTNVVPAVTNSTGSGNTISGGIALQTTNSTLTFAIGYGAAAGFSNLTGQATAVSLNGPAPAGSNAPVLADLSPFTFPAIEPTNGGVISIGHVSCSEFTLNGQRWAVLHFRLTRRAGIGSLGA